jgi:hypothetical protein
MNPSTPSGAESNHPVLQAGKGAKQMDGRESDADKATTQPEREREFEIGKDESWFANIKRTYDEYQHLSLTGSVRSQIVFDQLNNVALQALQNAVETANLVGKNAADSANLCNKQAIAHRDVAINEEWEDDNEEMIQAIVARILAAMASSEQGGNAEAP